MDPNNPVVKLCLEGLEAEAKGKFEDARGLFEQAWSVCEDDYDACMAAHFLARHQDNPKAAFDWNQEALNRANAVGDARVQSFYSSLHLNLGHSYETLGALAEARRHYQMAADRLGAVPEGPYKDMLQNGIARGRKRTDSAEEEQEERHPTIKLSNHDCAD
jgi:tetratricopeptide (TPR) repeat protein